MPNMIMPAELRTMMKAKQQAAVDDKKAHEEYARYAAGEASYNDWLARSLQVILDQDDDLRAASKAFPL